MDAHEIERRLHDLAPPSPRSDLRAEILDKTASALRPARVDRFLAQPWPWLVAIILLVASLLAGKCEEDRHERFHREVVGEITGPPPGPEAIRAFLGGGLAMAVVDNAGDAR